MRYPALEKAEIIALVEQSHLPAKRTLDKLGIPRATFYRWYDRYREGGVETLADHRSRPDRGDCQNFCVRPVSHHEFTKRSLNMTANWVFASAHSRGGRFHSAAAWFKTRYSSFVAASSDGKCPLVRTARRSFEFNASMAFVV